ncbi:rsbT co-antagonist protein RsbR [Ectothiorhodospira magna]|uniref:RsbT co-antagonist protein RsbR n=1 Tax=Ectothiorhodospira magna TaxID=867345 RepID=A0A1H9ARF2_9GAMM|nr:STAS domain-containing protein [Ectothiorhodospira magna]SEP79300.1 rsbT co-antagonist protein RsbR [Ectothiorhodospira magna]
MSLSLPTFLQARREAMLAEWIEASPGADAETSVSLSTEARNRQMEILFDEIMAPLLVDPPTDFLPGPEEQASLQEHLQAMVTEQARHAANATDPIALLFVLRQVLLDHLAQWPQASAETLAEDTARLTRYFDQITLFTFDSVIRQRDRQISEQSMSLMELSTPVLRLWHQILLLPLVGIIDTGRARQVTDHLLEAIARHEARVTVIDLTGVPIIDTSVAQHIMKTIDAARLLGSRVVLTGISPEGAQTLTKLGIRFGDVTCRASLRAGIAEALLLTGKCIASMEDSGR